MSRTIVGFGDIERHGIKDVHHDFVAVRGVAVRGRDGDHLNANFLKFEDKVTCKQPGRTSFGGLWVVHPIGALWAVDVRQTTVEVDDFLPVRLQINFLDVRHVQTWGIVDRIDANGDGLIGKLLAIAGPERDDGFAVHVVIHGLVA